MSNIDIKNINKLSEKDCNSLKETLYLASIPKMKEKLIKGKNKSKEACISEEQVKW